MCLCVSLHRKQLKLKINRPTAKSLRILSSISSTPCKTGENKTAAVFGTIPKGACPYVACSTLILDINCITEFAV